MNLSDDVTGHMPDTSVKSLLLEKVQQRDIDPAYRSETVKTVTNYVTFCRQVAISAKDTNSLLKAILTHMKSISRHMVYKEVFVSDPFLDWSFVERFTAKGENCFGDTSKCIRIMAFIELPDIDVAFKIAQTERETSLHVAVLTAFVKHLKKAGLTMSLEMSVKMLLLYNMTALNGCVVLEQFSGLLLKRPTQDEVLKLIANFADQRFTTDDYSHTISWILRHCVVKPVFLSEVLQNYSQQESLKSIMTLKCVEAATGRPRLSDRLQRSRDLLCISSGKTSILTGSAMDTFDGWCSRVRFPNTISSSLKHRLYLVMSQPHVNHAEVVPLCANSLLAQSVLQQCIVNPDVLVISQIIERMDIQMAPFPELTLFIRSCFRAFAQSNLSEMTILKYMQLYIAAYQHEDIWKECWTYIYPLLSFSVIKDVESFVKKTPFNQKAFIEIIKTD